MFSVSFMMEHVRSYMTKFKWRESKYIKFRGFNLLKDQVIFLVVLKFKPFYLNFKMSKLSHNKNSLIFKSEFGSVIGPRLLQCKSLSHSCFTCAVSYYHSRRSSSSTHFLSHISSFSFRTCNSEV